MKSTFLFSHDITPIPYTILHHTMEKYFSGRGVLGLSNKPF